MTEYDAQRIQQHTGVNPEELEDHDLEQAMQELRIQSVLLSNDDYAELRLQPPVPQAVVLHRTPRPSLEDQLQSLHSLKEKGLITEDDYNMKKKQVLEI